ncbi:DUF4942 domain-containing protein [Leptospira barantonii]|nr:DUF4942 domain-containing protein [Leptospira barantonii]
MNYSQDTTEIYRKRTIPEITKSRDMLLVEYNELFNSVTKVYDRIEENRIRGVGLQFYFPTDGKTFEFRLENVDELKERIRSHIDRRVWILLAEESGLYDLMDEQSKESFNDELEKKPPEVTTENVQATFERLEFEKEMIFERGLINVFKELDRNYVSNDTFKVAKKIIIRNYHGFSSSDKVRDVERILYILDGKRPPEYTQSVASIVRSKTSRFDKGQKYFDSPYLQFMIYGNGNLHLTFKRPDLLERINKTIARSAGSRIPEKNKSKRNSKGTVYSRSA